MSEQYGIYVSVKDPQGHLFSSFRESWAEVEDDLKQFGGDDFPTLVRGRLTGNGVIVASNAAPTEAVMTADEVAAALTNDAPAPTNFEACGKCGSPKDKWVPPGVSRRTNKAYPGFFGCSNSNCR